MAETPEDHHKPARAPNVSETGSTGVANPHSDIFFSAVATTRMPMILTDPNQHDNPIVFANPAFLDLTGYTLSEIIGRNCRFLQGPDSDQETIAKVREAIQQGAEIAVELLNYRKDGASFWNALFISPVYDNDGHLAYFFASQLDISRRRDAELALRQSQKMEAIGQLTGGIAHDFNNLLQVISGYMDLLRRQAKAANSPKMVRQVEAVAEAAARASSLTQQLLAFARKQKLEGRIVNLNDLVLGMSKLARRTMGDQVSFSYALNPDLRNVRLDPTQAETALLNILINSRDAMPDGGTIMIETSNRDILAGDMAMMEDMPPGSYVVVSITDSGVGIPPDMLKHVMDPFFTTKEEGKGTGLGLSMVYGFAKQSGGAVRIYSEVGEGTTVRLFFLAADISEPRSKPQPRRPDYQGGTEHILIVDDRREVAELAGAMLEDMGYTVEMAGNSRQALAAIERGAFDLLFTDVIMPGDMNGISLARTARKLRPEMKILLTTGYAEAAIEQTRAGTLDFALISKPYTQSELSRRVRQVLDGAKNAG